MNIKNHLQNLHKDISINLIKNIVFFSFVLYLILFVVDTFILKNYISDYIYQEWLINYSQGFIRRGFLGTIILLLNKSYGLDVFTIIKIFLYLTFLLFITIYILQVKKAEKFLDIESWLVVLLLPSLVLFPVHDTHVIGRKELFFFLGLFINISFIRKGVQQLNLEKKFEYDKCSTATINQYCRDLLIWYNLLSVPVTLSHESILFLSLPLNIILTTNFLSLILSFKQAFMRTLAIYCPTIIVALLCFMFPGTDLYAIGICQSWQENINLYQSINCEPAYLPAKGITLNYTDNVPIPLQYIGFPIRYLIMEVWQNNIAANHGLVFFRWISAFALCTIILLRTSARILRNYLEQLQPEIKCKGQDNQAIGLNDVIANFTFKYAFIPFIFSSVLYMIAQDWGRWFFVISTSYTICLLSPSLMLIEIVKNHQKNCNNQYVLQSKFLVNLYSAYLQISNKLCEWSLSDNLSTVCFLALFFTLFDLKIPHYGVLWDWSFKPWIVPD
jgi:hypothetical protein